MTRDSETWLSDSRVGNNSSNIQEVTILTDGGIERRQYISVGCVCVSTLYSGAGQPPRGGERRHVRINRVIGRVRVQDQSNDPVTGRYMDLCARQQQETKVCRKLNE